MAYAGSTSGSTVANPPARGQNMLAGSTNTGSTDATAWCEWLYRSTHTQAEAAATGFITDAQQLGMSLGDAVLVISGSTDLSQHIVVTITSTGCDLNVGHLISSAS